MTTNISVRADPHDVALMRHVFEAWYSHADPDSATYNNATALKRILDLVSSEKGSTVLPNVPPGGSGGGYGEEAPASEKGTITAQQLADVKDQCETGLRIDHDCPAVFALAAIYADLFADQDVAPQDDLKGSEALHRPLAGLAASSHRPDATPAVAAFSPDKHCSVCGDREVFICGRSDCPRAFDEAGEIPQKAWDNLKPSAPFDKQDEPCTWPVGECQCPSSAKRESVLEEAAKVCEQMRPVSTSPDLNVQCQTLDNAARLIRALR